MADALFPFPSPTFVFVHRGRVIPNVSADPEVDDDGWPVEPTASTRGKDMKMYVSSPSYRDAASGLRVDAVILVPREEIARRGDLVNVKQQMGLHPMLAGLYKIDQVRPNASHTRLLVARNSDGAPITTGGTTL